MHSGCIVTTLYTHTHTHAHAHARAHAHAHAHTHTHTHTQELTLIKHLEEMGIRSIPTSTRYTLDNAPAILKL